MSLPPPMPHTAAVVTGASSGIGAEIARELHRRGHQVVLVARSVARLDELAAELNAVRHDTAYPLPADLTDRVARAELSERIATLGLTPDVLINNAGFSTVGPVRDADPEAEVGLVELDVTAVVDLCTRFVPGMVERGRGAVLNVASTAAFQPLPGQAAYAAAKAFVLSYTESLHAELRDTAVAVTALCPGPVRTMFGATAGFKNNEDDDDTMPAFLWMSASDVAKSGIDALEQNRRVVIPGATNKIGAVLAQLTPHRLILPIVARNHPGLK